MNDYQGNRVGTTIVLPKKMFDGSSLTERDESPSITFVTSLQKKINKAIIVRDWPRDERKRPFHHIITHCERISRVQKQQVCYYRDFFFRRLTMKF